VGFRNRGLLLVLLGVLLVASLLPFLAGCGGGSDETAAGAATQDEVAAGETAGPGIGVDGKVLMVVAPQGLNDKEYGVTRRKLEEAGYEVVVASSRTGEARGSEGTVVAVDLTLAQADPGDYLAVAFIGGNGVEALIDDADAHSLARGADREGLIVAAICMAPSVLAEAGVLEGKTATAIPSVAGDLERGGATYVDEDVVVDGRIVTGCGPFASEEFGTTLVRMLNES
jgi:deglycase